MAGVSVKMGVTGVSEFKRGMNEAKESVKTLNEQLKYNEAQLKATGNQEFYASVKAGLLQQKLEAQKQVVQEAWKALESMRQRGVSPTSTAFQKMQQQAIIANTELKNMETELKGVEDGSKTADQELANIGKGVSWQNVTEGLDKVISKLESGARAAINFGKKVIDSAKDSTKWADDLVTLSQQTGIDTETLQRMQKVAEIVDTDVDAIIAAKDRMKRAAVGNNVEDLEEALGVKLTGKTADDLFWEIGDALINMGEDFDKEAAAQKVFGRSWRELLPLFKTGREEYEKMLGEQSTVSEENVKKLQQADDAFNKVEQEIQQMKNQFWADNADKITGLLQWLVDNQDSVVAALMAIAGGFGALKIADFALNLQKTIDGFQKLGLFGGGKGGSPTATGTGTGGGGAGGLLAKITGGAKALWTSGALAPLGVLMAGITPALIANQANFNANEEKLARRISSAGSQTTMEQQFLAEAAAALGYQRDENGNINKSIVGGAWLGDNAKIQSMLMGMKDRSGIELSKLHNMLSGSYTSQGNDTWLELQRLWGGEEMDIGRQTAILDAVTDAYENLVNRENEKRQITAEDLSSLNSLPEKTAAAVAGAVSGITINIDGQTAGNALTPYVSENLANGILGNP